MPFYEDISRYYDTIFPTGSEQVAFLREAAGSPPKDVLDVACGTGGYSLALAGLGHRVTASDIDAAMLEGLKRKLQAGGSDIACVQAGMLDLTDRIGSRFDLVFCIGNSVVHLKDKSEIGAFFKGARELLNEGGALVLQIINFDRVLLKDIRQLPPVKNEEIGLNFERYYRFDPTLNQVFFRTVLTAEGKVIENEIPLFPLLAGDAVQLLQKAGFTKVSLYGDFNRSGFDKSNSYMLVIQASN